MKSVNLGRRSFLRLSAVAGGGVMPLRDVEDRGVLETALAGRARYLATYNLDDFAGAATQDADTGALRVRDLTLLHPVELAAEPVVLAEVLIGRALVQSVVAVTDARNAAAVSLLQRVGFRHGSSAPAMFRGEQCQEHTFVFTQEEWAR